MLNGHSIKSQSLSNPALTPHSYPLVGKAIRRHHRSRRRHRHRHRHQPTRRSSHGFEMASKKVIIDIPSGSSSMDDAPHDYYFYSTDEEIAPSSAMGGIQGGSSSSSMDASDGTDESSEEEVATKPRKIMRGPNYGGSCLFDKHCIFANNMELQNDQVKHLNDFCKHVPGEPIKYYVYKMTASSVIDKKCKMEFGIKFTNQNLRRYIKDETKRVLVEHVNFSKTFRVNLKLGMGTNKAMLSGGWAKAVAKYKMKEGEIYMFCFTPSKLYGLEVELIPL